MLIKQIKLPVIKYYEFKKIILILLK